MRLISLIFVVVNGKESDVILKTLAKRVREIRKQHKLSQEDLANLANIPVSTISRIERGICNATIKTVHKIAVVLKVSAHILLNLDNKNK